MLFRDGERGMRSQDPRSIPAGREELERDEPLIKGEHLDHGEMPPGHPDGTRRFSGLPPLLLDGRGT